MATRRPMFADSVPLRRACRVALVVALGWLAADGATRAMAADDLVARRQRIASMSPVEQQELLDKYQRFSALPPDEQERLRELQAAIDADPKAERLREVLAAYHEWLKTLSPGERAELLEMSPTERVEQIAQRTRKQAFRRRLEESAEMLTRRDMNIIVHWIERILWQQRDTLVSQMSPRHRERFNREDEQSQRRHLVYFAIERARSSRGKTRVDIRDEDIGYLSDRLSPQAREELGKRTDFEDRRNLIGRWVLSAMFERSDDGRSARRAELLPKADVAQFFDEELSAGKRDELMRKDPRDAREELRRMYWRGKRSESMFRGSPRGPRGGGPRPDRRGPDRFRPDGPRPAPHEGPPLGGKAFGPGEGPPPKSERGPPRRPRSIDSSPDAPETDPAESSI